MICSLGRTTHDPHVHFSNIYRRAAPVHDWTGVLQLSRLQAVSHANMKIIA
jgi:hypothetical protein